MTVMISGSIAYDNILSYNGRFSDHLIADSLDHINLTFVTESMTRNYGGCAANTAYALKLLGGDPIVVGAVGTDGNDYLYRFEELGIKTAVSKFNDTFTAQCFITTDTTGSQLATFNPGAMNLAHKQPFPDKEGVTFALIAPDGREAMLQRVEECVSRRIPFVFDIGQGVSLFNGEEIRSFIEKTDFLAASAYEMELIERATGLTRDEIASRLTGLVITHGAGGSTVYTEGTTITVPAVRVSDDSDPVGAGDAFRGGMLYGLSEGWDWTKTLRLASTVASFKVQCRGGQNYKPSREDIARRYEEAYGEKLEF